MSYQRQESLLCSIAALAARAKSEGLEIEQIAERVGLSHAAFLGQFRDLDACLDAAHEHITRRLVELVESAYRRPGRWPTRVRFGVETFLDALALDPQLTTLIALELPACRPQARRCCQEAKQRLAALLEPGPGGAPEAAELPAAVELMAIGAAEAIVVKALRAGAAANLRALAPDVLFALLVPYLGPKAAIEQAGAVGSG